MTTIAQNIVAKLTVVFVAVAMVIVFSAPAQAQESDLQAQIDALMAQITALQAQLGLSGGSQASVCPYTWTRSLSNGDTGADVMKLQQFLNADPATRVAATGVGSAGQETEYYGPLTGGAVAKFQEANRAAVLSPLGLVNSTTFFGPSTRAEANAQCTSALAGDDSGDDSADDTVDTTLEGGAGSITLNSLSDFTNEEVGEGENDVEVMAFEVEAEDDSDIRINSIRVEFVQNTGADSEDLPDYADSVSIWFMGDKVAEVDSDRFSENNDVWTKSIKMDEDVIIRAGDTEVITIAVSALNNLDSGDIDTDAWVVDALNVRYVDADGVVTTEDADDDALEQNFDFTDFGESADIELKLSLEDDDINDANVIDIDATSDTDRVELLSFNLEAEGTSDIFIKDLSVRYDSVGFNLQDGVSTVYLYAAGVKIGSESMPAAAGTDETIEFNEIDYTIDAGDTIEFIVKAKVLSIADGLVDGDTLQAQISATERALIDAEDEAGDDLVDNTDMTGTAIADAHSLFDDGINVVFISSSFIKTSSDTSGINETVEFTLVFEVTAFGEDIWVEQTCTVGSTGTDVDAVEVSLDGDADGSSTTCTSLESTGDTGTDGFEVLEGQTETFTVTILGDGGEAAGAGNNVTFQARLNGIGYNVTLDAVGDTAFAFDLDDYESSNVTVFDR